MQKTPGQLNVFLGLKVSLKLFSSVEEVARVLQSTDVSADSSVSSADAESRKC